MENLGTNLPKASRTQRNEPGGLLFWAALVVGIVVAGTGLASLSLKLTAYTTGQLILCSGLGMLFGAFGSTATIKYKGGWSPGSRRSRSYSCWSSTI